MSDVIGELRHTLHHHRQIAATIADTLALVEQTPIAALYAACAHYDNGGDPDAVALAEALAAACQGLEQ
jgi:hypothetical protein